MMRVAKRFTAGKTRTPSPTTNKITTGGGRTRLSSPTSPVHIPGGVRRCAGLFNSAAAIDDNDAAAVVRRWITLKNSVVDYVTFLVPLKRIGTMIGTGFDRYGQVVGRHPIPFLLLPLLLTVVLSMGLLRLKIQDDVRFLYSPEEGPSRYEYKVHRDFSGDGQQSTYCALAVEAGDASHNLLTKHRANVINDLNKFVLENLTFAVDGTGYHFGRDICPKISYCPQSNRIVERFIDAYFDEQLSKSPKVALTYPVMDYFGAKLFLPTHLYGVRTLKPSGRVTAVSMVHLVYSIPSTKKDNAEIVAGAFENGLNRYLASAALHGLDISMFSLRILKQEVNKNTAYTLPYISVTVVLLVTFTIASCMTSDWVTSKPLEALMGVASSSLAVASAAGLMAYIGVPFITQVTVMPFIALAIGIDDTYIILGAWQRTDRRLSPDVRLGQALRDAGSAITVTSITDCLSFMIGAFSSTPAISIFCKYVAAAIAFDFLYQTTFFAAVTAIGGMREQRGYHSVLVWRRLDVKAVDAIRQIDYKCPIDTFFERHYAKWICKPLVRLGVFCVYFVYLTIAVYGCSLLRPNLSPSKLVVDDSPLKHYIELAESHIWSEGLVGRIYVQRAPDFALQPNETGRMMQFVMDIEQTRYSMGTNSSQMWLKEFLTKYYQYFESDGRDFYGHLQAFLSIANNKRWSEYVQWKQRALDGERIVDRFYFTSGFQIRDWAERTELLLTWRKVCAKYPDYQAIVYDEQNFYADQVLTLPSTTLQALGIALFTMAVVCVIFIADRCIVFWVVFNLLSMDVGIAGFLSLWGADLSPTTVVCILMSIGLSVDFATHIAYKIHLTKLDDPDRRIEEALGAIAWPVCQGGVSTLLAIVVFLAVQSHVVRVFARTTILVVAFGLFHGLVLLPVILRTFVRNQSPVGSCLSPSSAGDDDSSMDDGSGKDGPPSVKSAWTFEHPTVVLPPRLPARWRDASTRQMAKRPIPVRPVEVNAAMLQTAGLHHFRP